MVYSTYIVSTYENETDSTSVTEVCPFVFLAVLHGCASEGTDACHGR